MPTVAAPKLDATIWQPGTEPVTTSSFLPPPKRLVRAWHRIPVPAVARPCMIWKRTVGEPGTDSDSIQYALAAAELESQGQGERKRARKARHVPVWGEAQWDIRVEEPRDGSWDLVEARASVAAIQDEQEDIKEHGTPHRPAMFPEEKLRWVPRKRHNSRWPIEPISRTEPIMMAEIQPLVNFEVPTANIDLAAAQDSPQRATDKQMRRRSTRRLSRRVSFAHIEDVSVSQTPAARRISQVGATPTKSSPTKKVSASPQKAFTLLATPGKVQFRPSPHKARSPAMRQSPLKAAQLSPASKTVEVSEAENSSLLSDSSVVVFQQPVPEAQAESAQETRRRVSLQNARRLERRSIGGRRSLEFGTAPQPAPNRRHSFMPRLSGTASLESSSRRHTLDVVGESSTVATEMEQDEETTTGFSSAETTENIFEVVVDVCANLDIFGQKSGVTRRRKGRRASGRREVNSHSEDDGDAVSSPQSAASGRNSDDVDDSPLPIGLGITYSTEVADGAGDSPDQAAVLELSFSMPTRDSDDADKDFWLDDGIGSMQCQQDTETVDDGEVHHDDMFAPHDPEGLSTIFEDEEAFYAQSSPQQQPTTGEADNAYSSTSSPVRDDTLSTEGRSPSSATTGGADDHTACSPTSDTSAGDLEQEKEQTPTVHEVMEQSFDFSMIDTDEVEQENSSVRDGAVRLSTQQPEVTTEKSNMSPSSSANPRDEEPDAQQEHDQSDCYPSPPEDDDSTAASEDDCCRTIMVEDFPAHEEAATAQNEPDEAKQGSALDGNAVGTLSNEHCARPQVEVASSPAAEVEEMDVFTSTPPQAEGSAQAAVDGIDTVLETPPTKGFTPINSDRVSPPQQSPGVTYVDDEDQDEADDIQDEDMALALDYEPTVPINLDDETIAIDASEPDTEPAAMQEDSETEMLRKFVTRVSANKSAKAAAAAALARRNLRPKRRSGSTGSTTSVTGSPIAKPSSSLSSEAAQRMMTASMSSSSPPRTRLPLGEKDANSPSPTKKRKAGGGKSHGRTHSDDLFKGNPALYSAEISPPKSKRLRSRRRVEAESDTSSSSSNNQASEQQPRSSQRAADTSADSTAATGGVRRSTRSRSSRVQLKPPAPSANSIALSLIPVRLPGSSSMVLNAADTSGDKDMPTPVVVPRAAARSTAEEKDLAAVTRVNTRKNKGGAMPPKVVLSRQAEDPLGFKLRELKGVFDAREGRQEEAESADVQEDEEEEGGVADGRKSRKGKGVRWASELVRFNTDFEVQSPKVVSVPLPPSRKGAKAAVVQPPTEENADGYFPHFSPAAAGEEATTATAAEQQQQPALSVEEVAEEQRPEEGKQAESETKPAPAPTRRTRQSRLQAPTPISKKILAESTTAAAAAPKVASASVVKMATRRTKIASLGMGVNGTPAPKRRTRT